MLLVKKYKFRKLLAVELLAFSCSLAYSDWMMYDVSSETPSSIQGDEAVCYIKGTTNLYFNTVDGAIRYAYNNSPADNIYLIVDHKDSSGNLIPAYLKTDCTLASNDTLTLPYDAEENYAFRNPVTDSNDSRYQDTRYQLKNYDGNSGFGDKNQAAVNANRRSQMIINEGATLTVNGKVRVGGMLGQTSTASNLAGNMSGYYSEILMEEKSKITFNSGSKLDCYGYIKERNDKATDSNKANITFNSGSSCYQPLVFYDYSGGSNVNNDLKSDIFPISQFDFPNVQAKFTLNYGANLNTYVSVYIYSLSSYNGGIFNVDVLLISSSNAVINLHSSAKVVIDYHEANYGFTGRNNGDKTDLNVYGGCDINDIEVDTLQSFDSATKELIKGFLFAAGMLDLANISTANKKFPFSYRLNINLYEGNYNLYVQAKLLPGFNLFVDSASTVNLNWSTVVYPSYAYLPRYYPSSGLSVAKLVNEGTLNISNTFGGRISVPETFTDESKTAYINFSSSANNSASSVEYNGTNSLPATISYISPFNEINNDFQPTIDSFVLTSYNNNYYYKYVNSDCNFSITNIDSAAFNVDINGTTYSESSFRSGTYLRGSKITFKPNDDVSYFIVNGTTHDSDDYLLSGYTLELNSTTSIEVHKEISVNSISVTKSNGGRTADPNIGFTFYTTSSTSTTKGNKITVSSGITKSVSDYKITTGDWVYMTDEKYDGSNSIDKNTQPSINSNSYSLGDKHLITDEMVSNNALNVSAAGSSCIKEGTKILDSHFNYVNVEDIKPGDDLLVFNHYTGKLESGKVLFNDFDDMAEYKVIYLYFENNIVIPIITEHGFFDIELNQYVLLDEENVFNYINHKFLYLEGNTFKEYRLLDVKIEREFTRVYSPVTEKYLNYFTEGYLSMPGATGGLINIFELDSNHVIDKKLMQKDIETYGTFGYEDFKPYISEEFYNAFNGQYLKVSLGKGLLTVERIKELIKRYSMFD